MLVCAAAVAQARVTNMMHAICPGVCTEGWLKTGRRGHAIPSQGMFGMRTVPSSIVALSIVVLTGLVWLSQGKFFYRIIHRFIDQTGAGNTVPGSAVWQCYTPFICVVTGWRS